MMFLVEKTFKDKITKKVYKKGTLYQTDDEKRVEELRKGGFLGSELVIKREELEEQTKEKGKSIKKEVKVTSNESRTIG